MAMTQDQIRTIDNLRQRLFQLSTSIGSLRASLERENPIPSWPSLQSSAQALSFNLQQLTETLNHSTNAQLLRQAHAYPLPTFPGHVQEGLLGQLLRKKLEPEAEKWIEDHTINAAPKTNGHDGSKDLSAAEMEELWGSAASTSQSIVGPMLEDDGAFADDYTIAEREGGVENVVTGLKRKLDGESESEEEDEDDEMDVNIDDAMPGGQQSGVDPSLPPLPLDDVLRFMTTGVLPARLRLTG